MKHEQSMCGQQHIREYPHLHIHSFHSSLPFLFNDERMQPSPICLECYKDLPRSQPDPAEEDPKHRCTYVSPLTLARPRSRSQAQFYLLRQRSLWLWLSARCSRSGRCVSIQFAFTPCRNIWCGSDRERPNSPTMMQSPLATLPVECWRGQSGIVHACFWTLGPTILAMDLLPPSSTLSHMELHCRSAVLPPSSVDSANHPHLLRCSPRWLRPLEASRLQSTRDSRLSLDSVLSALERDVSL